MKKSIHILFGILILFLFVKPANAQFKMKVGPVTGMNFNIGTGSSLPETLTGFGFLIGGQVDMNFTPTIGIIANLQFYDNRSGSTSKTLNAQDAQTGQTYPNTDFEDAYSLAYFMFEPLFKLGIARSGFYFVMGPMIGFNIESSRTKTWTNSQYFNAPIEQKSTLQNMLVRFGVKAGAGYDINLGSLVDLTPQFNFEFGITNVQSNVESRILTFQILVAAKFKVL